MDRNLDWDGCFNARDLGGLRTVNGGEIRRGALVRSEEPDRLTPDGWTALREHGIRTIVDLREESERPGAVPSPDGTTVVHVPLEDSADTEFWEQWGGQLSCTPLYYRAFLDRFPERIVSVLAAVARARPGGVLVHCGSGRDRTGLVILVLLALAGVVPKDFVADYELSAERLPPLFAALGMEDQKPVVEGILAGRNTSAREVIRTVLASLDVDAYLRAAGLGGDDLTAIRIRLLGPIA